MIRTKMLMPKALKFSFFVHMTFCVVGVMMNDAMIIFIVVITINWIKPKFSACIFYGKYKTVGQYYLRKTRNLTMATFPFLKNKIKTRIATIFLFQLSFSSYQNNNNNNDSYNGNVIHVELIANGLLQLCLV